MSPYKFKPSVGVNLGVLQFGVELDEEADDYVRISDYYLLLNEIRDLRSVVGNIENQLGIFHDQYLDFIKLYKKDARRSLHPFSFETCLYLGLSSIRHLQKHSVQAPILV